MKSGARVVTLNGDSGPRKGEGTDPRLLSVLGAGFIFRKTLELLDGSDAHRDVAWIEVPG